MGFTLDRTRPPRRPADGARPTRTQPRGARAACALDGVLRLVTSRWTPDVLWVLLTRGPTRFGVLRRAVPGVSVKTLTARLRALEQMGFVGRAVVPTVPPEVTYALTPTGHELRATLTALRDLAVRWGAAPAAPPEGDPAAPAPTRSVPRAGAGAGPTPAPGGAAD